MPLNDEVTDILEYDNEDYESFSGDQASSKRKKNVSGQSPKRRGKQNELVLKHRVNTMATPWLHKLVSLMIFCFEAR
jgi:hypothetical protein